MTEYRRLIIYYMSGTGNALAMARGLLAEAENRGLATELVNTDRFTRPISAPVGEDVLIGFLYPTHGFNLPWHMLKFLLCFPSGRRTVFCANTFGGTKIGRIPIPGLSGLALILPALILLCKGCRVRGLMSYNMPSNWITVHPAFRPRAAAFLADFNQHRLACDAEKLLNDQPVWRGLYSLPLDLVLTPVALAYFLVGRFWLAKMYIASSSCNACGLCERLCPVGAIHLQGNRPFWSLRCESCMRCINICPQSAIQVSPLFTILAAWLLGGLFFPLAVEWGSAYLPALKSLAPPHHVLLSFVRSWILLGGLFVLYRLVQALTRWQPFNMFFAGISHTRLPFWRRYLAPDVKPGDFKRP